MVIVVGYILVAVNLSPQGDVDGTAINYYKSNIESVSYTHLTLPTSELE